MSGNNDFEKLIGIFKERLESKEFEKLIEALSSSKLEMDKNTALLDDIIDDLDISSEVEEQCPEWRNSLKSKKAKNESLRNALTGSKRASAKPIKENKEPQKTLFQQMLAEWCQVYRSKYL
jgi:hypothetical protein